MPKKQCRRKRIWTCFLSSPLVKIETSGPVMLYSNPPSSWDQLAAASVPGQVPALLSINPNVLPNQNEWAFNDRVCLRQRHVGVYLSPLTSQTSH